MGNLMKCPFCGGEANVKHHSNNFIDWWEVECSNCHVSQNERYEYEFEAVAAWNTRKPEEAVVAKLEKEKEIHTEHFRISLYKDYPEIKQMYEKVCLVIDKAISIVRGKE